MTQHTVEIAKMYKT